MMKRLVILSLLLCAFADATVTIQIRTQLGDYSGTATNGLNWGILVDADNDGFDVGLLDPISAFNFTIDQSFGDDDFYFVGATTTTNFALYGGDGVATELESITLTPDINTGDQFGIFWQAGSNYGFVTDPNAKISADGNTTDYSSFFNADPYSALGNIVPEPSNYASIIGFVALSLALLRRRGVMVKNL